eukprot:7421345-Ditylum_brightwellii.AAC.1
MIDPAICRFEIKETTTKSSNVAVNIVEQTWLTGYLWPQKAILNRSTEIIKYFITLVQGKYGIKCKPIATRNPQANSIVKRAHQTISNFLCMFEPGSVKLDPEDPCGSILSAVVFALWSIIHTTHKAILMQLVFGKDAMLNGVHLANWKFIQEHQQNLIKKNNKQENAKWKPHMHHINDEVMIKNNQKIKYRMNAYSRLY